MIFLQIGGCCGLIRLFGAISTLARQKKELHRTKKIQKIMRIFQKKSCKNPQAGYTCYCIRRLFSSYNILVSLRR